MSNYKNTKRLRFEEDQRKKNIKTGKGGEMREFSSTSLSFQYTLSTAPLHLYVLVSKKCISFR